MVSVDVKHRVYLLIYVVDGSLSPTANSLCVSVSLSFSLSHTGMLLILGNSSLQMPRLAVLVSVAGSCHP